MERSGQAIRRAQRGDGRMPKYAAPFVLPMRFIPPPAATCFKMAQPRPDLIY
jgi:hypothetical protein